ncbi:putative ABC transport system permease protein [Rhodopseudomonas faecalis]|uniref:Putative ABC transport system permease protein n=1 Tax=Rhodopseudomonas faecalis TaxID=99655 RepID=A0A318TCF7_9BRAD|nr:ABC transporter permease [Rhodopseudomonas faecalis]PYF02394.1 putative ABC transport system permease protein [Rhodopseudomonas faecalis]
MRPLASPPAADQNVKERADTGRVSLARRTLLYEWRRYLAALLAVAFSGLLVLVQIALLLGMFRTTTTVVENAAADLWLVEPTVASFDLARELSPRAENRVRAHPAVQRTERLALAFADWRGPQGARVAITLVALDVSPGSLAFPRSLPDELREALQPAGTVLVDQADLNKLGVEYVRDGAEIDGRRVRVAGVTTGFRAIGGAMVFVSEATYREIRGGASRDTPHYVLAGLAPGQDVTAVRQELREIGGSLFRVMTPDELASMSQLYWLLESGTGIGFLFSTVLGLLVGVAITSQTLRAAVLSSLREYATLRALGVPLPALRAVVLEQATWIGAAGFAVTALATVLVVGIAISAGVAVAVTWWAVLGTALFSMLVSIVSGLMSLGPLLRTEPAELLR